MYRLLLLFLLSQNILSAQPRTDAHLSAILSRSSDSILSSVIKQPAIYRLQIIYTVIDRDAQNRPSFHNYYFHYDPALYFNPASLVKLPLAALALEKINTLRAKGIDRSTTVLFDSSRPWQKAIYTDSSAASGQPTIGHLVKRALLISENDPYNRLYQFVGQQQVNRALKQKGYNNTRITRQFLGVTPEQNRHTNAVRFIDAAGKLLYYQPPAANTDSFDFSKTILVGDAHFDSEDRLIPKPFDFTVHNTTSLADMQRMLQAIIFPASVPRTQRFNITESDRSFLLQYLSQYPSETPYPKYDTSRFYDSYVKFFFRGNKRPMPEGVRVFNKVGWSYGFMSDVSYIANFKNGVEFMLAATIYVNSDGVINDGKYDYEPIGYPFFYALGQTIYEHELKRERRYQPGLRALQLDYEKRDPADKRPALQEVDN